MFGCSGKAKACSGAREKQRRARVFGKSKGVLGCSGARGKAKACSTSMRLPSRAWEARQRQSEIGETLPTACACECSMRKKRTFARKPHRSHFGISGRLLTQRARQTKTPLKTTRYFDHTRQRPDRSRIQDEWIQLAIDDPTFERVQSDGRLCRWVFIESERKYLRVILLEDGETVHNAFFDRGFKP